MEKNEEKKEVDIETGSKIDTSKLTADEKELVQTLMGTPQEKKPEPEREEITIIEIMDECRLIQRQDVINNHRLGIYDKDGRYIIEPEIINELKDLPKTITDKEIDHDRNVDTYTLTSSILDVADFEFKLVVSATYAKLYLIENVYKEGGSYLEAYQEKIDSINFVKVVPTYKEMMLRFNATEEDEQVDDAEIIKRFEKGEFDAIAKRKLYLGILSKSMQAEALKLEEQVYTETVIYLKNQGE